MKKILKTLSIVSLSLLALPALAEETTAANIDNGRTVYEGTCIACHGEDGTGAMGGLPNFRSSESALYQETAVLLDHILNGFESGNAPFAMPPKGGNEDLSETDIADVLAYMRGEFLKK